MRTSKLIQYDGMGAYLNFRSKLIDHISISNRLELKSMRATV